ncbi:reelin domain-containing protein 1-like [Micropterus salmoides]|uniref:reelin domain-containing protein 1-like n=1 Tax=Micropterus salmoides TaxID=27706 RepID=UPI0018EC8AC9|nr:reelin domain-containing protein 1-like [Micropterus salmoides]
MTFSRGASHASCQEMIPGHIRAQPQNLQHNHVTLRASASSYLPGQLFNVCFFVYVLVFSVTVRSSRDFMGFLLQARSVEGAGGRAGVGFKARKGVGAGVRSTRVGPVLVGGSWTVTPPGTHTLRCLSEGDTLTHTDKQPKRNLSFVWRAPDVPMGDIRFYITVVQSYFVYWAGISSAVVRDGSHSHWSGSNITGVDERNSISAPQEDEVAALQGMQLVVTEEAGAVHTEDPKSSLFSSSHLRFTDSFSSAEAKGMDSTTSLLPNITVQNTTSILSLLHSLASLPPLKDVGMERKDAKRNFHDPKLPTIPETKDTALNPQTSTMVIPLTSHSFHNLNFPRPISQNPKGPIQDQTSPVKFKTQSSPSHPWRNSLTTSKISLIKDEMDSQTLIQPQNPHLKALVHSQTGTSQSFPESHTTSSHTQAHLQSQAKIKTMSPIFVAIPPSFSTPHSSSFSSTHTLPASSPVHSSSTTHRTESSTLSTTPHPEPSPAPRRSLFNPLTSTASPVPSQQLTLDQWFTQTPNPIQTMTQTLKLNTGHELKPHPPNTDTKPKTKHPSGKPDREGKYPDITPRHSAWELGMLLGCSATLGMVLVIGIRYMYRQACAKRTEVTLNDREREYGRGERGLIHVQECGDLVRVRKIRENSFVLLAEYDILAPPGD